MRNAAEPMRILFLCTGNSCRSQMAEGWARALHPGRFRASSAGTMPHGLNPLAVRVMAEAGVDISGHTSKHIGSFADVEFDAVITVCDGAKEACPRLPGNARHIHAGFDDPPALASVETTEAAALGHYRRVRDEIRRFVDSLPITLSGGPAMTKPCCDDSCCTPSANAPAALASNSAHDERTVREIVRDGYARIVQTGCCSPAPSGNGGCCGPTTFSPDQLAQAIGYSASELATTPDGANMGLSCGNPTAIASLRPGETVLDLGAGGGFDCFVAGPKVGRTGRVIGVDMTAEMLGKARRNTASYREQTGLDNVEFRLGEIEALPVADASVDVVISNCVLNLSPDKPRVWREIARVLKPGGRVAVSDLALTRPLPDSVRADVEALIGCIAGAVLVEETRAMAAAAGLTEITLTAKPEYIDAMTNWEDPLYKKIVASLPTNAKPSDFITSLDVMAVKREAR